MGPHDRVRRLQNGVGSVLSGCTDRGAVVCSREESHDQLPRATRCFLSPANVRIKVDKSCNIASVGQCHSNRLYQQNGWISLRHSLPPGSRDMELVPGEEPHHPCRAPTGEGEYTCSLGTQQITAIGG